ncbi:hypothetical protein K492DRAFT_171111 [Lichtheimia hyalospora FSU 10163]|nr:hypothetical protein K492DRAFT_171111 [Lichtheimia hyalospora FSU 10163]
MLQRRVQSIETDMKDVSTNTRYVADEFRMTRSNDTPHRLFTSSTASTSSCALPSSSTLSSSSQPQWSLSLTPNGLRIDTNVISIHALYDMLLGCISPQLQQQQLQQQQQQSTTSSTPIDSKTSIHSACSRDSPEVSSPTSSSSSSAVPLDASTTTLVRKKNLWKTRLKTFPLYSTWEAQANDDKQQHQTTSGLDNQGDLYDLMSDEMYSILIEIYDECMLMLPCVDPANSVVERYKRGSLDPLLLNAVMCWTARHAAVHHNLFPGQDPNKVGEPYFVKAKELLKERFAITDVDTMHSLLIMYVYAIGRRGCESEAYMYLGLAIRMCLDMKMYREPESTKDIDPLIRERDRRFFWAIYFLETLCSIHSDRPFSLPPEDTVTAAFPDAMDHEQGERRWRVMFINQRFRITRIYRNIIHTTAQDSPLLASISNLDKELQDWYDQLPTEFKYVPGQDIHSRDWSSTSFREQACLKLNWEFYFQISQLYSLFASRSSSSSSSSAVGGADIPTSASSAIDLLAQKRCLQAADVMVELLECFGRLNQRWCHFSLETIMVPAMIYRLFLSRIGNDESNEESRQWFKQQLERIVRILTSSPVRQHKYVVAFVNKIERLLTEQQVEDLDLSEEHEAATKATSLDKHASTSTSTRHDMMNSTSANPTTTQSATRTTATIAAPSTSEMFSNMIKEPSAAPLGGMMFSDFFGTGPPGTLQDMLQTTPPPVAPTVASVVSGFGPVMDENQFAHMTTPMDYYSASAFPVTAGTSARWTNHNTPSPMQHHQPPPSTVTPFAQSNYHHHHHPLTSSSSYPATIPLQPPNAGHKRLHDEQIKGPFQFFG